ncbi:DUF790 family protein [Gloeobacter morelensis]|uniref:DUF790 family protein n=1 Tax=Gloeobacter morelensis MG652769 TaxID=2781736 RepID=A0ABY3PIM9_9CYAN|nr:DUF790 family protein [Gloeobacter morelensis]UFP93469.1 DUF790 family protein [Gloeobacter morelensis MG652769]
MLPGDLLIHTYRGEVIVPRRLGLERYYLQMARELIEAFRAAHGQPQAELDRSVAELESDHPDYRVRRGLVHLLKSLCTFEVVSPIDPQQLRSRVYALAAKQAPGEHHTAQCLEQIAEILSAELGKPVFADQIRQSLFADLPQNRILTQFEEPSPEALLHRFNLSQVQGVFYRATHVRLNVHRNDPGEYKYLFRFLKLFGLMTYIEGDPEHGFTLTIDGPTSLFQVHAQYGLALAKLLPALLHVKRWHLVAQLKNRDPYSKAVRTGTFQLDAGCGLVSHYPPGKPFDSMIEQSFAEQWNALDTEWQLEREVHLLPIPGSVMIPDFRLVHPDGRTVILEIVGYWRPEYLRKKFSQVRRVDCADLLLAVSERLNLEKAGVKLDDLPARIVWYKDKLSARAVLKALG